MAQEKQQQAKQLSRAEARRTKDKWKSKKWFNIYAPPMFSSALIGEGLAEEAGLLMGRVPEITMQELTGDFAQMHVKLRFRVNEVRGQDAHTVFIGHDLTSDYVRRQTRRKHSKMDVCKDMVTKDGWHVVIKPLAISDLRIKSSQQTAIRTILENAIVEIGGKHTLVELTKMIVGGDLSKELTMAVKGIYPVKRIEIRRSEVLARKFEVPEEFADKTAEAVVAVGAPVGSEPAAPSIAVPAPAALHASPAEFPEKEAVLGRLLSVPGVGPSKALSIFDSGIHTLKDLEAADTKRLMEADGITDAMASKVVEHLRKAPASAGSAKPLPGAP
ncbi:MAG TPA: 30S ribosomal protein S3ae [Candidatus Thermoplasmatota archaeon]|nr:30S ribosomal protein S3ae [Candidatus Thermoplasmatota archaeon]